MPRTIERGIRETPWGFQVYTRKKGILRTKHLPHGTSITDLREARDKLRARAVLSLPTPQESNSFGADCANYLRAVAGMPTFRDRQYRIERWRDSLGPLRSRADITAVDIRQQLERWRADGLSAGSLNLRRTALMHLYSVLDGKAARNVVKDVPRYRETPPAWTLPSLADAIKAVDAVLVDKGHLKTRARLRVLLWTGWPAAQLMRLEPEHVKWSQAIALVRARRKGKGTRDRWLPLLPQAVAALQELKRAKAWGTFSTSAMHSSLHRACDRAKVTRFHPYALRHLFLTLVAQVTKDDRVVAELAMHSDVRQTRVYTEQSVSPRLTAGMALVAAAVPATPATSGVDSRGITGRSRRLQATKKDSAERG